MAHFVKLNVLDPGHDEYCNKYNVQLINLDMVVNVEKSCIHSLIFIKNNLANPIRVRETLDDIYKLARQSE